MSQETAYFHFWVNHCKQSINQSAQQNTRNSVGNLAYQFSRVCIINTLAFFLNQEKTLDNRLAKTEKRKKKTEWDYLLVLSPFYK